MDDLSAKRRGKITSFQTLWSWHRAGFDPGVSAQAVRGATGRLTAMIIEAPGGEFEIAATDEYLLQLDLSGGSAIDLVVDGIPRRYGGRRGSVTPWLPRQQGLVRRQTPSRVLAIALAARDDLAEPAVLRSTFASPFHRPRIAQCLTGIWGRLASVPNDPIAEDESIAVLIDALHESSRRLRWREAPPLNPPQLRAVVARMTDALGERVRLADLALSAGMPPVAFLRAFKEATGLPPHQYLLRLRLERAADMLANRTAPICEIALDCGFSSQAHLTSTFSRAFGLSPAAWRKHRPRWATGPQ